MRVLKFAPMPAQSCMTFFGRTPSGEHDDDMRTRGCIAYGALPHCQVQDITCLKAA